MSTANPQLRRDRMVNALCCAAIALAVIVTYGRLFRADFTNWDDAHTVAENSDFKPPTFKSLVAVWSEPRAHLYVPVTYSVWWTLAKASYWDLGYIGEIVQNPRVFHMANIALHAATACFVTVLLRRLGIAHAYALIGAMIFALHPVQVEAVAWVSGLKDVLCGLLCAIALWQYVVYAQTLATRAYVLCCVAFIAAMLSKPTAVMFPLMALAIDAFVLRRSIVDIVRGIVPLALFSLPAIYAAAKFQNAEAAKTLVSLPWRPVIAFDAITFYLAKIVWPINLAIDYGRHPRALLESGAWRWTIIVPIVLTIALILARRKLPEFLAGAMIFVAALLPLLGFRAFDFQQYSTVADHYLYMPMIGVALIVATIVSCVRYLTIPAAIICLLLAVRTFDQTRHWMNSRTLWEHTIAVNSKSWVSYLNLGEYFVSIEQSDRAIPLLKRSMDLSDNDPAHLNLGAVYLERNQLPEAMKEFERAIELRHTSEAHTNLANVYGQLGRIDDAIAEYEKALQLDRKNEKAARMLLRAQGYRRHLQTQPSTGPSTSPATMQMNRSAG